MILNIIDILGDKLKEMLINLKIIIILWAEKWSLNTWQNSFKKEKERY